MAIVDWEDLFVVVKEKKLSLNSIEYYQPFTTSFDKKNWRSYIQVEDNQCLNIQWTKAEEEKEELCWFQETLSETAVCDSQRA